jgi:prophage maintenance system killer protein
LDSFVSERPRTGFDLPAIEASLRGVRQQFHLINQSLAIHREPMDDAVVDNLMAGYALVGQLVEAKIDLFSFGGAAFLLELNARVLCGINEQQRREYQSHITATQQHFYDRVDAGIQDLAEWYALHRHESVWQRAAGVYIQMLSEPQMFIEGNDRTGMLVVGYLLAKEGHPPFVLSVGNAKTYFDNSQRIKTMPKNALSQLFRMPRLKAGIANYFKQQADQSFLR